jgi:hypothetical protein
MDLKNRLDKLKAAFKVTQEFQEIIEKDRSPVMDNVSDKMVTKIFAPNCGSKSNLTENDKNRMMKRGCGGGRLAIVKERLMSGDE